MAMLLPSALACPSRPPQRPRLSPSVFASPPASPSSQLPNASNSLWSTCRALQSMLGSPPPQLPTPPMQNATLPGASTGSPMRLRLRSAKNSTTDHNAAQAEGGEKKIQRRRVVKRQPPRGKNKRRRDTDDEAGRDDEESEVDERSRSASTATRQSHDELPSTPKRIRLAPAVLPFGLEQADFDRLHEHNFTSGTTHISNTPPRNAFGLQMPFAPRRESQSSVEGGAEEWTSEDDRLLVDLVLQKLKLSKSEWQDCARHLGRDKASVNKRWRTLFGNGEVGLRGRGVGRERSRIHSTWR